MTIIFSNAKLNSWDNWRIWFDLVLSQVTGNAHQSESVIPKFTLVSDSRSISIKGIRMHRAAIHCWFSCLNRVKRISSIIYHQKCEKKRRSFWVVQFISCVHLKSIMIAALIWSKCSLSCCWTMKVIWSSFKLWSDNNTNLLTTFLHLKPIH